MNRLIFEKLNQLYIQLLNRNLIQKELIFYKKQIQFKQFSFQNTIQLILNSEEFTRNSLQNLKEIFNALQINIEDLENIIVIEYLQKLRKGYPLLNLTNDIINDYKKKTKTQEQKSVDVNENDLPNKEISVMITKTFQKILERTPTNKELIKYKIYDENSLENILLHTIECSNLIDRNIHKMIENAGNN